MHRLDERDYDAAALRIAERVRSSLDIPEVLRSTLDELGHTLGVARAIIQLAPDDEGASLMLEWVQRRDDPARRAASDAGRQAGLRHGGARRRRRRRRVLSRRGLRVPRARRQPLGDHVPDPVAPGRGRGARLPGHGAFARGRTTRSRCCAASTLSSRAPWRRRSCSSSSGTRSSSRATSAACARS